MDYAVNIDNHAPVTLTDDQQKQVVEYVRQCWDRGKNERVRYEDDWKACVKAYNCEVDPEKQKTLEWRSRAHLPWAYDAIESWYAYMHGMTLPRAENWFDLGSRTPDDQESNKIMGDYLKYAFKLSAFAEKYGDYLRQLGKKGQSCMKVLWKESKRQVAEWVDEPVTQTVIDEVTGQPMTLTTGTRRRKVQNEETTYNNIWFDVVDVDNFVFYPVTGDFDKTTRIHETYKYLEDLKAEAKADLVPYFNLEQITLDDEKNHESSGDGRYKEIDGAEKKFRKGLKIKEAWIHRIVIDDKPYSNFIATIVNDKWLVRFQPNSYPGGRSPFIFQSLIPDGLSLYGWGLVNKGIPILRAANFLLNSRLDVLKLGIYGGYKYLDDGVFNPYNFVSRPGGLYKVGQLDNLVPIADNLHQLQAAYQEVAELKVEFEEATVPKVVKGMIDTGQKTATEMSLAQDNSSGKMHVQGFRINELTLKPVVEMAYDLIRNRIEYDERVRQDIARVTLPSRVTEEVAPGETYETEIPVEELVKQLPEFLPLPEMDVQVVGYQNSVRKQESLAALERIIPQVSQTPAAGYLKWDKLAEQAFSLAELDHETLMASEDERKQIDNAQQAAADKQQQLQEAEIMGKIELEKAKLQLEMEKIALEREKMHIQAEKDAMQMEFAQQQHGDNLNLKANEMEQKAASESDKPK